MINTGSIATGNAALYFVREAYESPEQILMGREVANSGFLDNWVRHAKIDGVFGFAPEGEQTAAFLARVQSVDAFRPGKPRVVPFHRPNDLSEPGAVFHPGPNLAPLAWTRRRFAQRGWSIVGVTHTTSTDRVGQNLARLLLAPMQPWDALVCPSTAVRKMIVRLLSNYGSWLQQRFGIADWKTRFELPVIPLGIDTSAFDPSTPAARAARASWRTRMNMGHDDIAVLWVGRFSHDYKANPWPMYEAAQRVAVTTGKRIHIVEAGWFADDDVRFAFDEAFAAIAPALIRHVLDGRDPDVRRGIWFAADIFCSLVDNIQETFGITPVEAMAAGLPLVVSDWDGYRDTVRQGIDGIRVPTLMPPTGSGDDLAMMYEADADDYVTYCGRTAAATCVDIRATTEALTTLVASAQLRAQMGAAGRMRATSSYDWSHIIGEYQALLRALAEVRQSEPELCPQQHHAPPSPLRDDPFRSFDAYPSRAMHPTDRVTLTAGEDPSLTARRRLSLRLFNHVNPVPPAVLDLVLQVAAEKSATVDQVIARLPKDTAPGFGARLLCSLAKAGLIAIAPYAPESPTAGRPEADGPQTATGRTNHPGTSD